MLRWEFNVEMANLEQNRHDFMLAAKPRPRPVANAQNIANRCHPEARAFHGHRTHAFLFEPECRGQSARVLRHKGRVTGSQGCLLPQYQRQPILVIANNYNLAVRALGQIFCGLNPFPF